MARHLSNPEFTNGPPGPDRSDGNPTSLSEVLAFEPRQADKARESFARGHEGLIDCHQNATTRRWPQSVNPNYSWRSGCPKSEPKLHAPRKKDSLAGNRSPWAVLSGYSTGLPTNWSDCSMTGVLEVTMPAPPESVKRGRRLEMTESATQKK